MVVPFENLIKYTKTVLTRILRFFGVEATGAELDQAKIKFYKEQVKLINFKIDSLGLNENQKTRVRKIIHDYSLIYGK